MDLIGCMKSLNNNHRFAKNLNRLCLGLDFFSIVGVSFEFSISIYEMSSGHAIYKVDRNAQILLSEMVANYFSCILNIVLPIRLLLFAVFFKIRNRLNTRLLLFVVFVLFLTISVAVLYGTFYCSA